MKNIKNASAMLSVVASTLVVCADVLPAEYQQVEYIKANGNCQVRTGITPACTDTIEMTWLQNTVSGNQALWCARNDGAVTTFTAFSIGNKVRFDRNNNKVTGANAITVNTKYKIVANGNTLAGTVTNADTGDAVTSVTMTSGDFTPGTALCLFASHTSNVDNELGNYASHSIYSFKISNSSGTETCNLVPARRVADGVLGFYDTVRSAFLTNSLTGVFTTAEDYADPLTPDSSLWGTALSIGGGETVVIDGGTGASWSGAITVMPGGTLVTRGELTVSGATSVNADGTLDIESGSSTITFNKKGITGTTIIRSGATLNLNSTDAFNYQSGFVLHVYGTLACAGYRISAYAEDRIYLHDGALVTGTGDGNGVIVAVDENSRIIADGESVVEGPVKACATLKIACCENAHPYFKGGFIYGISTTIGDGDIVQATATAEEGNAAETSANAIIEIGPGNGIGKYSFTSKGIVHLLGATPTFTVETSASELDIVASNDVALANHCLVQTIPEITTSTATVRLKGDCVVALRNANPTFPIILDGPTLQVAFGEPVALAAGSSVVAASVVGVEGLAAATAATIFTGADAMFDVSMFGVKAMYNGVALGTAVTPTLADGNVSITGVEAFDTTAWIEPYIKAFALIWLDASDDGNFEFKDNTREVTTWKDLSAYGRDAIAYVIPQHSAAWGTLGVADRVPAYMMGTCNSGIDLSYTRMTNIRTGFWAMSIVNEGSSAFWLGDTSVYNFHRGGSGQYSHTSGGNQNNTWYCDGTKVANITSASTLVPTDRHVYSVVTAANGNSDRLTCDRSSGNYMRHGGRNLSELILFPMVLSDSVRQSIEAYLAAKWMGDNPSAAVKDGFIIIIR